MLLDGDTLDVIDLSTDEGKNAAKKKVVDECIADGGTKDECDAKGEALVTAAEAVVLEDVTVSTDKSQYVAGSRVDLSGSGWTGDEFVAVDVTDTATDESIHSVEVSVSDWTARSPTRSRSLPALSRRSR